MKSQYWLWLTGLCFILVFTCRVTAAPENSPVGNIKGIAPPPAQPGEETWKFIEDLKSPLWDQHNWRVRKATAKEADLSCGVRVDAKFPDTEGLLETAYADLGDFLTAGEIAKNGPYVIETAKIDTSTFETYRIEVTDKCCRILAADTEGIRRGIFYVENMMLRSGGPFLPLGIVERKPFIKSRISRCFFGPIKRPPKYRDELADDVDYYPAQYLNRLAHEGINGLWLTVAFRDLCKTSIAPEFGKDAERRLAKLRKTVEKCRRYGIKIYIFTIEPISWRSDIHTTNPATTAIQSTLKNHPELVNRKWGKTFCPWSEAAQKYLYECTNGIFSAVPHLGGLINISYGERVTTCLSSVPPSSNAPPRCDVCSKKKHWEVLNAALSPMAQGMKDANPEAELIAWLYMPQTGEFADWIYEVPKHIPENVIIQVNFESDMKKTIFGREYRGGDYWHSTPGPSERFQKIARVAKESGKAMSAKIQTGCSHEVATVPFVPVPGNLYQKFRAMRELGVSHAMLCWYFGNYPGIMNQAAGELSFEPFPETEQEFLDHLAGPRWGKHADQVVRAWQKFSEGYRHFPLTVHFQYYGPLHDGVVWPLLLRPQDAPLAPTWLIAAHRSRKPYAPSGDRVGEALVGEEPGSSFTLDEGIKLCRMMSQQWHQGIEFLRQVESDPTTSARCQLDIGVAKALDIQFRSGYNILQFYGLRERMAQESKEKQLATLGQMRQIVEDELKGGSELIELCQRDSRLGFHSEAEGYKYFPEKIRWRMDQLQKVLDTEIPALEIEIKQGKDPFAEYTGRSPKGPISHSFYCANIAEILKGNWKDLPERLLWQSCSEKSTTKPIDREICWTCCHDDEAFYFLFTCTDLKAKSSKELTLNLMLEPRRLWPCQLHRVSSKRKNESGWQGWTKISYDSIRMNPETPGPLRINVWPEQPIKGEHAWVSPHFWPNRLRLGSYNPSSLGWIFFEK